MHAHAADNNKTTQPTFTVQLLNIAGVNETELAKATAEASWIFGKAGVKVKWVHCNPESNDHAGTGPCGDTLDALSFSMGLVSKAPDFLRDTGMGFALVYSGQRNHAGVVYSRVAELARANALLVKTDLVLAYAIVHEIAHLILGSTDHSPAGILRAGCRPEELAALSQRRLLFGPADAAALHRKLLERSRTVGISRAAKVSAP